MKNWYIVNEEIFEMEKKRPSEDDTESWREWVKEWNKLIDESKNFPGCIERSKYEEIRNKKEGKRNNV